MKKADWNPDQYLKFKDERTQPSIDLVNRIRVDRDPARIADIGCGPGNSSRVLLDRWPHASLTGIDKSPAMIEKAKIDFPDQTWIVGDAADFASEKKFDIVFSNATIQWIPDHSSLFERFFGLLEERGIIAIQVPMFSDMTIHDVIVKVSEKQRWKKSFAVVRELFTYHDEKFYYDLLSQKARAIDIWITEYIHIMPSHEAILEWTRSTAIKPYLERLVEESDKIDFEADLLAGIAERYPVQKNRSVLFPFKRLFFICYE
jgi:trans-aconitate 2-methyltransferase